MIIHESAEMYLVTIYRLSQQQDIVKSVNIADSMGYSKPTISEWMAKLSKGGYVHIGEHGSVTLTKSGLEIAQKVYGRHVVLGKLFKAIGVSDEVAEEDACRVEHYISDETFACLKNHLDSIESQAKPE